MDGRVFVWCVWSGCLLAIAVHGELVKLRFSPAIGLARLRSDRSLVHQALLVVGA